MRAALFAFALAAVCEAPLSAQTPASPTLSLTIFGGLTTGHHLWSVDRQPICVLSGSTCSADDDTVRVSRSLSSSIVLGLAASYYPRGTLGVRAEIVYLGLPTDDTCSGAAFRDQRNADLCDFVTSAAGSGSAVGFFLSAAVRATRFSGVSPYVRLGGGVIAYSSSTIEVVGTYADGGALRSRALIAHDGGGGVSPSLVAAAGVTAALGPGYQLRIEVLDVYNPFEVVTGPADRIGQNAATGTRAFHHVNLTIGLDIVLEQRRGRRY